MCHLDNVLGLSRREAKLVDRVHEAEDETRRLKRQLTISQNQLISLLGEQQKNDNSGRRANDHFDDDYDNGGGEEGNEILLFFYFKYM